MLIARHKTEGSLRVLLSPGDLPGEATKFKNIIPTKTHIPLIYDALLPLEESFTVQLLHRNLQNNTKYAR